MTLENNHRTGQLIITMRPTSQTTTHCMHTSSHPTQAKTRPTGTAHSSIVKKSRKWPLPSPKFSDSRLTESKPRSMLPLTKRPKRRRKMLPVVPTCWKKRQLVTWSLITTQAEARVRKGEPRRLREGFFGRTNWLMLMHGPVRRTSCDLCRCQLTACSVGQSGGAELCDNTAIGPVSQACWWRGYILNLAEEFDPHKTKGMVLNGVMRGTMLYLDGFCNTVWVPGVVFFDLYIHPPKFNQRTRCYYTMTSNQLIISPRNKKVRRFLSRARSTAFLHSLPVIPCWRFL